jgi:hypothetical protein
MKKHSNTLFTNLTSQQLDSLTTVIAETIATGDVPTQQRTFTAAELWNIQRQKRSLTTRRFSF